MGDKIDFVLTWVDGNDIKWQEEKNKFSDDINSKRSKENRYRDWDSLKYWFRGVEKFAPWVNNIYFVTCGQCPKWLNLNHPKLKFIKHEDYIPKEYLPTFSANPIEINFHRIKGLSDKFVYFNDDIFLTNKIDKQDFFKNNKPRLIAGCDIIYSEDYDDTFSHILLNDSAIINKYFNKKAVIKKNFFKWFNFHYNLKTIGKTLSFALFNKFSSFIVPHLPTPILKSTIEELWKLENNILDKTSRNKFRTKEDVNQYIFSWYDIARNNFEVLSSNFGKYFAIKDSIENVTNAICKQKYKIVCISDDLEVDFEKAKKEINKAFEKILPQKSDFEI